MSHLGRFVSSDRLIVHVRTVVADLDDPALVVSYSGFMFVAAVTVFELAIKV